MMSRPRCHERGCSRFRGVIGDEPDQRVTCDAFPEGIPDEIAYGDDLHLEHVRGDGGLLFEKELKLV